MSLWFSTCHIYTTDSAHPAMFLLSFPPRKNSKKKQQSSNKWFFSNPGDHCTLLGSRRLLPWQLPVNIPAQIFPVLTAECHLLTIDTFTGSTGMCSHSPCFDAEARVPIGGFGLRDRSSGSFKSASSLTDGEFCHLATSRQSVLSSFNSSDKTFTSF